jgi:hypothetical protein
MIGAEYGGRNPDVPRKLSNEVDDITSNWESLLSHVYSNEQNRRLIERFIKFAKASYQEDKEGWKSKLTRVREQLADTDDEEEIKQILLREIEAADPLELDEDDDENEMDDDEDRY